MDIQILRSDRLLAVEIAFRWLNTPYRWGGDDFAGVDCSGFVIEVLQSVGEYPLNKDTTAQGLYDYYPKVDYPDTGRLVFYGSPGRVTHVELCINMNYSIGASGGGSGTHTEDDAARDNAYVKVRPIERGRFIVGYCDPFKEV